LIKLQGAGRGGKRYLPVVGGRYLDCYSSVYERTDDAVTIQVLAEGGFK
jgi:hypothetical protein